MLIRLRDWRDFRSLDLPSAERWLVRARRGTLVSGILWGAGWLIFLYAQQELAYQLLFIYAVSMMSMAGLFSYGSNLPMFLSFSVPAMAPGFAVMLLQHDLRSMAIIGGLLIMGLVLLRAARSFNRMFSDTLQLRFENANLVAELTRQKEAAETANVAKSRFLAAASHDLRQPMHALSLYLGALAGVPLSAQGTSLLAKVRQCAHTMDELFRALLDISKLDAGAVQPALADVELQPLLERIRVELEPQARAKGIELRLVDTRLAVRTDAELLERIVRNLVSNAVRYTERGKVLIGCRRRGEHIVLSVIDTGIGIASDKQRLVFEEFYQVANQERDRSNGLGLGLAIVARLTQLLATPLQLQSTVNKGSVFSLTLPLAKGNAAVDLPVSTTYLGPRRFGEKIVVVIDDEELILDAARVLLEQWGCEVVTADSGEAALERLSNSRRPPDLLICDYRLRGNETGIEVIDSLRSEFNTEIPAILLTGDTAPDRIQKIGASGLPVLHKPLREDELEDALAQFA